MVATIVLASSVKKMLMSIWEVNEQATSFILKEFYDLLSSEDLRKAFVDAKQ